MTRLPLRLTFIAVSLATSLPALATNGTMPHGYGIKAQGMGGASIALPQDALAAANNPAGMAFVGNRRGCWRRPGHPGAGRWMRRPCPGP